MMNQDVSIQQILRAVFLPGFFQRESEPAEVLRVAVIVTTVVLAGSALILFFSAWWNQAMLRELSEAVLRRANMDPGVTLAFRNQAPTAYLWYPLYWLLWIFGFGSVRYLLLRVFGEEGVAWPLVVALSALSVLPLVLSGFLVQVSLLYYPLVPGPADQISTAQIVRGMAAAVLSVSALCWENIAAYQGYRARYAQNAGRAFLTAILPYFGLMCMCYLTFFFGY